MTKLSSIMKEIIKISLLVIILGCNQSKIKTPIQKEIVIVIDTIIEEKDDSNDYLKRVEPTNGKFSLENLSNEFCLVFGIGKHENNSAWENINRDSLRGFIIDPTYEEFSNLRELRAQRIHIYPNNDSLPICKFGNSILIPFTSNEDVSHLIKWEIISPDSIAFDKLVQPSIERRYSNIVSIELIEIKDENYLSIYMEGGEGGSNWDELMIVKLDGNDKFDIVANEGVGYCHDCGDWAKIHLNVNPEGFEMTEIRDSMRLIDDSWVRERRKKKKLKTVKI
jgi:hypothetical protein